MSVRLELVDDCLTWLQAQRTNSVDLIFTSPPYEDARHYGVGFKLKQQAWVDWALPRFIECVRVCRGLTCWVVEGRTRSYSWSATPVLLMADLVRAGITLRKPPIYQRFGIPGSGGPDWWRNDYETIICGTKGGRLVWSDNTATGSPPIYGVGGPMSNRTQSGARGRGRNGAAPKPYSLPEKANPGNVINCGAAGGGNIGSEYAHENEAPFPEALVEPFILSFCRPGGTVLDPFCGSGTTLAVADRLYRSAVGLEIRQDQLDICVQRLSSVQQNQEV